MSCIVTIKNMSIQLLQPLVPPISLEKTEPVVVIKNEHPESEIVEIGIDDILDSSDEEIISNIKDRDIVSHKSCESSINNSEAFSKNILESKHCMSVGIQTENIRKDITQSENLNNSEDTSDRNIKNSGSGQGVVEVQGSNEHFNALVNLDTNERLVLNFSDDFNSKSIKSRKPDCPKKTDFVKCYRTSKLTPWENDKEKIKFTEAAVPPILSHEYTSLRKEKYVCNYCQYLFNKLEKIKRHIRKMHREIMARYQCPYCPFKSNWRSNLRVHIIQKHKNTKDIQWFQYHCDKCDYKTFIRQNFNRHKVIHLKPEETRYFHCYHCSYKSKQKEDLKSHILRHFKKREIKFHCYICNFMTLKRESIIEHIKKHSKVEIQSEINKEASIPVYHT